MSSSSQRLKSRREFEFKKMCSELGCSLKIIRRLLEDADDNYSKWTEDKTDSLTGLPKRFKDGTTKKRQFSNPFSVLKKVQRKIKCTYLANIPLPKNIHGGVKNKNNITNSKEHQGNKYIFTTDLQDFFPSISPERVYYALKSCGFSSNLSHWITRLTTTDYSIPQGAPTSMHMANIVFLNTDYKLIQLCAEHNVTYTRYVDDLTFSSQQDFQTITRQIIKIISDEGYKISFRKTKYGARQKVTGVIVYLNRIDAPNEIIVRAREEVNNNSKNKPLLHYIEQIRKTNYKTNS